MARCCDIARELSAPAPSQSVAIVDFDLLKAQAQRRQELSALFDPHQAVFKSESMLGCKPREESCLSHELVPSFLRKLPLRFLRRARCARLFCWRHEDLQALYMDAARQDGEGAEACFDS